MLWLFFIGTVLLFIILEFTVLKKWKKNPLNKRKWIVGEIFLISMIVFSGILVHFPPTNEKTMETKPYLQITGPNAMTVMWTTNYEAMSWVEYGLSEDLGQNASSSNAGLLDVGKIHRIALANLTLGSTYYYRVVSKPIRTFGSYEVIFGDPEASQVFHFTLPSASDDSISFLALADIHEHTDLYSQLLQIGSNKSYDILFLNGDLLSDLESHDQIIDHLLKPLNDNLGSNIPFAYVRGNHETRGEYARELQNYLTSPTGSYFYSFNLGKIHFTVLDGGEDKNDSHKEYSGLVDFESYRVEETEWLEDEVNSIAYNSATFRIVFIHIPLLEYLTENLSRDPFLQYKKTWADLLNATGTDLILSGHEHTNYIELPNSGKNPYNYPVIVHGGYSPEDQSVVRCDISSNTLDLSIKFNNASISDKKITLIAK